MDRRTSLLLPLWPLLASCAGSAETEGSPPRAALRPTRELHLASRLVVDRQRLAPRHVALRPSDVAWTIEGGKGQPRPGGGIAIVATGKFTAWARVAVDHKVPYVLRLVTRGRGVGEVGYQRLATVGAVADSERTTPIPFDGTVRRLPATAERHRDISEFLGHLSAEPGEGLAVDLRGEGGCEIAALEIREPHQGVTDHATPAAAGLRATHTLSMPPESNLSMDSLLAAGRTTYEWPWTGEGLFTVSTGVVRRHGQRDPEPLIMSVHILRAGGWRQVFSEVRGARADNELWHAFHIPLPADTRGLRLETTPSSPGAATWQVAWGGPLVTAPLSRPLPDIYLFTVDALRADHVGAYGARYGVTPTIDELAREGVVFEEARAQRGQTWESLVGLMHSEFPERVGVAQRGDTPWRDRRVFTDPMERAGMETHRIGQFLMVPTSLGHADATLEHTSDSHSLELARRLISSKQLRPRFTWIHFFAPHYPFPVSPAAMAPGEKQLTAQEVFDLFARGDPRVAGQRVHGLYLRALRSTDAAIGELVRLIKVRGRPAIVAVLADHGTTMGEGGVWAMHSTAHRAVLRVPLVLWGPGILPAGRRTDRLVRLIDVGPTLLDYAGLDPTGLGGTTLRALVEGRPEPGRVNAFSTPERGITSDVVETDELKVVATGTGAPQTWSHYPLRMARPVVQLYRWREDPAEQHDLAAEDPLTAGELLSLIHRPGGLLERYISPATRRLLAEAGYAAPE